jgi:hypothetical protein
VAWLCVVATSVALALLLEALNQPLAGGAVVVTAILLALGSQTTQRPKPPPEPIGRRRPSQLQVLLDDLKPKPAPPPVERAARSAWTERVRRLGERPLAAECVDVVADVKHPPSTQEPRRWSTSRRLRRSAEASRSAAGAAPQDT